MPAPNTVLIIDDEIDLCLLLREYFLRKKFEVVVAHTLEEGKKLLNDLKPVILFLDNNLPDGTGWNKAPGFVQDVPGLHIVLMSAFHPHVPVMPAGAHYTVIEKPIGFSDLDKRFAGL